MKTLSAWNNSIKRAKKANAKREQRRRDIQVEKDAGIWEDPRDMYLNADGTPKTNIIIPTWFLNIYKTWNRGDTANEETWNKWCDSRIDNTGIDPRQKKVGRPKLPLHMKKNPTKLKRSDQMRDLLLENGIHLTDAKPYADIFLVEYPEWQFMVNGRLKHSGGAIISVHKFLANLATT